MNFRGDKYRSEDEIVVWIVRLLSFVNTLRRSLTVHSFLAIVSSSNGSEVEIGDTWRRLDVKLSPLACSTRFSYSVL